MAINLWLKCTGVDLANFLLISRYNKRMLLFYYVLLMVIVNTLELFLSKIKKGETIAKELENIVKDSVHKPNKVLFATGNKF